ncbi:MAG: type I methionyl aminopeptidase [Bacilli bacterium]
MINIYSGLELENLRKAGKILHETHNLVRKTVKPGIKAIDLDTIIEDFIKKNNAIPSFKGYNGFKHASCISINDEVVHGIPNDRIFIEGDIVSVDIGVCYNGFHSDSAYTYKVGKVDEKIEKLLEDTERSLYAGIKMVKPGNTIGDISAAIEKIAKESKLTVVRELAGHGVGKNLHEDPEITNYGKSASGPTLKEGMVIAIEPMLNLGSRYIKIMQDGWTIKTKDKKPSAHFEHTILVTKDGYEILSKR